MKKTDNTSRLEPKITHDIGDSHPDGSPCIGRNQCQTHGGSFFFFPSLLCAREDCPAVSDPYFAPQRLDGAGDTTGKTTLTPPLSPLCQLYFLSDDALLRCYLCWQKNKNKQKKTLNLHFSSRRIHCAPKVTLSPKFAHVSYTVCKLQKNP